MAADRTNRQITLSDGRMLGFSEFGAPEGKPVFYFHGHPGSRLDWPGFADRDNTAAEMNTRIIAVDRPGHGLSDFKSGRTLLDWPDDVIELADSLQLHQFAVLGCSGGGPYSAACAFKIPERVTAAGIVSGMGPADSPGAQDGDSWTFAGKNTVARRLVLWMTALGLRKDPERFIANMQDSFEGPDKHLSLDKPEVVQGIADTFAEALRPGLAGAHHEAGLYARPWGFKLGDVTTEVHLWHGEEDPNVLVSVAKYVADEIPTCRATFLEREGHVTLIFNHVDEVLKALTA